LLAFASEGDAGDAPASAGAVHARESQQAFDADPAAVPRTNKVTWIRIALAALTIVALAQGALIALWVRSGRIAVPAQTGLVKITSAPDGAPVVIDGTPRGTTPFTLALEPGAHRIDVGAGAAVRTQTVDVVRGSEASMHIDLQPAAAPAPAPAATGGLQDRGCRSTVSRTGWRRSSCASWRLDRTRSRSPDRAAPSRGGSRSRKAQSPP
jgi:hypothetical protein